MPAQIWEVHMSNVRMSNADEGPAGGGIKAAGSKDTTPLVILEETRKTLIYRAVESA